MFLHFVGFFQEQYTKQYPENEYSGTDDIRKQEGVTVEQRAPSKDCWESLAGLGQSSTESWSQDRP